MKNNFISRLSIILKNYTPKKLDSKGYVKSGVIIPLYKRDGENLSIIFTMRSEKVRDHKNQVCFPGGVCEERDESIRETALREIEEEICIKRSQIEILGELDHYITITGYHITPFVGYIEGKINIDCVSNPEVQKVFSVPLLSFLNGEITIEKRDFQLNGKFFKIYEFYFEDIRIWGATAAILNNFIQVLKQFDNFLFKE